MCFKNIQTNFTINKLFNSFHTHLFIILLITSSLCILGCNNKDSLAKIIVKKIITNYEGDLRDIYFKNEEIGFIVGEFSFTGNKKSAMLRTQNGGDSWIIDTFNITNKKVEAISGYRNKLFIKTTDLVTGLSQIFYSNDDGFTWNYYNSNMSVLPNFFNEDIGISLLSLTVLRTSNSGSSWDSIYSIKSMGVAYISFIYQDIAYIAGGSHHDITDYGLLYKTNDQGSTWLNLNWDKSDITNMSIINENVAYLFTFSGNLYKTLDGGSSFKLVNSHILDLTPGCYFISELEGYYSSNNSIYWTNDGGKSWEIQFHDQRVVLKNKIVFNGNGFIIGEKGLILKLIME